MVERIVAIMLALFAAGCAQTQTISANPNPIPDIVNAVVPVTLKARAFKDLQSTAANLDAAASIGLPTADYAACQHTINQALGVEAQSAGAPGFPTVEVTNDGLVSAGSIVLIDALRLAALKKGGISVPSKCVLAFGTLQLDALGQVFTGVGGVPINVTP